MAKNDAHTCITKTFLSFHFFKVLNDFYFVVIIAVKDSPSHSLYAILSFKLCGAVQDFQVISVLCVVLMYEFFLSQCTLMIRGCFQCF